MIEVLDNQIPPDHEYHNETIVINDNVNAIVNINSI